MYATLHLDKVLFYDVIWHGTMPKNYKYFMQPVSLVPCVVVICQHKSPFLKLAGENSQHLHVPPSFPAK